MSVTVAAPKPKGVRSTKLLLPPPCHTCGTLRLMPSSSLRPFSWRGLTWAEYGEPVQEVWVESRLDSEWVAAFRLFEEEGDVVIGELRVFPAEPNRGQPGRWSAETKRRGVEAQVPAGGLTARAVRKLRFDETRQFVSDALVKVRGRRQKAKGAERVLIESMLDSFRVYGAKAMTRPRSRRALADEDYAKVAALYVAKIRAGSARPITELSEDLRRSPGSVRQTLRTARRRGFLTSARSPHPGRPVGELTERALEVLRSSEDSHG